MLNLIILALLSYLLGSFPTGVLMGYLVLRQDIRKLGSGNTGATNSFRVLGPGPGMVVAIVDFLKGFLAVALVSRLTFLPSPDWPDSVFFIVCSLSVALGHIKPLFIGFKGGMGFNAAAGAVTAGFPILALPCLLLALTLSGHVAFTAAVTALLLPFFYLAASRLFASVSFDPVIFGFFIFVFFLVFFSVRKKLFQYLRGEAVLFRRVMILKRGNRGNENNPA
jgi:glycerol-3-phosphate acyltransferase PlsY